MIHKKKKLVPPITVRPEVLSTVLDCFAIKAHVAVLVNASIGLCNLLSRARNCNMSGVSYPVH